jgi:SagB-type dehydrogenase family enzyme
MDVVEKVRLYGQARDTLSQVELFHETTKFRRGILEQQSFGIRRYLQNFEFRKRQANSIKKYALYDRIFLPPPNMARGELPSLLDARRSVRQFDGRIATLQALSNVLVPALGDRSRSNQDPANGRRSHSYASGGALYPIEAYVLGLNVEEISMSITHFEARDASLARIGTVPDEAIGRVFVGDTRFFRGACFIVILTAVFARSCEKYGNRGYLFTLLEAGEICQNLALAMTCEGMGSVGWGGYIDDELNELLGINAVDETVVACVVAGYPPDE